MKLKTLLKKVDENCFVSITFYAYGIYYANTCADGINTCKEVLNRIKPWLLDVMVTKLWLQEVRREGPSFLCK